MAVNADFELNLSTEVRADLRVALNHHREGRLEEAVGIYQSVVERFPNHAETLLGLGAALIGLGRNVEAIKPLEAALLIRPSHPDTCFALAEAYRAKGQIERAFKIGLLGLEGNPDYLQGHLAVIDALLDMERHEEARPMLEKLLARYPKNMTVTAKMGAFHFHSGEFEEAEQKLAVAAKALPDDPEVHWLLTCLCLGYRRWEKGWPRYRWRWPMSKRVSPEALFDISNWNGEGLIGKKILVWGEQGLGDELMFATCLPDLLDKVRPDLCVLVCDPRLETVFNRSFPKILTLPMDRQKSQDIILKIPACEYQIASGDIPKFLRLSDADFPQAERWLVPDPLAAKKWQQRLNALGAGLKVGVAWRGGTLERFKRAKSSHLSHWADILSLPGVQFVNLQYGDCRDDLEAMEASGIKIHNFEDLDPVIKPDEQMALIAGLDLVIQTSNASAHMAGMLGVPIWNLLPYVADWRWGLRTETCLWYPSMRLFRQPNLGDWGAVFDRVASALRELISQKK